MSILKQVLSEALSTLFRRARPQGAANLAGEDPKADRGPIPSSRLLRPPGLKVVILNWNRGENDPFTVFNQTLRQHFHACGKNVELVEITDLNWPQRLAELAAAGVEFAVTWQGLGSPTRDTRGESLWHRLGIPLICVHGDHPSHMPLNHELDGRYCFHLYANADAARYSNRHFRRERGAVMINLPQLHREARLDRRAGDYFVIAKNITDPFTTENEWRQRLDKPAFDLYMRAAETLKFRIAQEPYVDTHEVLDELLAKHDVEQLSHVTDAAAYHEYHSQLDHYLRSHKTVLAVTAIRDFPVRVYGRGWDRIARDAPARHVFEPGRSMVDSQALYYTRYGIVDISPSKGLHDRTRRAMVNGSGFLSNASLEDSFPDIGRFDPLFFSFGRGDLPEKCAVVVRAPDAHHRLAEEFAQTYHSRFHFRDFVGRIDSLAKMATAF
jgi:hypothetical protein